MIIIYINLESTFFVHRDSKQQAIPGTVETRYYVIPAARALSQISFDLRLKSHSEFRRHLTIFLCPEITPGPPQS
jgi:hypothetical protein